MLVHVFSVRGVEVMKLTFAAASETLILRSDVSVMFRAESVPS